MFVEMPYLVAGGVFAAVGATWTLVKVVPYLFKVLGDTLEFLTDIT